jgi:hypothetical protein
MQDAQKKITSCIDSYKQIYSDEYNQFLKGQKERIKLAGKHGLWQDTKAGGEWRKLTEIPLTLHNLLHAILTEDEWKYYESENGKLWLVKTFKEFLGREKI